MMDANGMFSPITTSGFVGVVDNNNNPLQHQQQQQQNLSIQQQNPHHLHLSQGVSYAPHPHDTDTHHQQHQQQQQLHQSMKHGYPPFSSSRNKQPQQQGSQVSDEIEDEPSFQADETSGGGDPKRKFSPWQRMKWTDTMVRLLIMAVYYIGDEGGSEGTDPMGNKKKVSGLLQKKGKWKSVSRAMMEKGFYVSPQQCEDKFNDLNKRYKRVNDILGKGTACRVVENQNLMDSMDLTPKMKDEVRKLLNSKHLFFREMCAYHNSCGHAGGGSNVQLQVEGGSGPTTPQNQPQQLQQQLQQQQQQQQPCFHSTENVVGNLSGSGLRMLKIGSGEAEEEEDEDEDDESEDFSDEDEDESGEGGSRCQIGHSNDQDDDENDGKPSRKRRRKEGGFPVSMSSSSLPLMNQMSNEISGVFQDGSKSPWEKKQWIRNRILQLEEQKISYESQAFELEKQRLKWARYSSKKEREMKRAKLENERRRLENERMVLLIRKKEIELMNIQQQQHQQQHSST